MAHETNIEWCDSTFNPWMGCTRVSPACDHCYAARSTPARTLGVEWGPGEPRRRTSDANWKLPHQWQRNASAFQFAHGRRRRVFCASLADVFDNEVPWQWRLDLFDLISRTPDLDWLLLTKRIGNVRPMLNDIQVHGALADVLPNVWLGITVVNQQEAARDIPKLLAVPAAKRFLSIEPMLGQIDLTSSGRIPADDEGPERIGYMVGPDDGKSGLWPTPGEALRRSGIDWVICGGESGPNARPMHPDWARSLRDQCAAAGVPFLFKQWGEHSLAYDRDRDDPDYRRCNVMDHKPGRWINLAGGHGFNGARVHYAERVGKKAAGRLLDGIEHNGFPESGAA